MNKISRVLAKLFNTSSKTDSSQIESPLFEDRMRFLENYFKRKSTENKLFQPEYIAAKEINRHALKNVVTKEDLNRIVQIYNDTSSKEHYNGTAWHDLKLHIQGLIISCKYNYEWINNQLRLV